ncbi:MAG: Tfp pilus assembly protein FimT/FimU [Phycisphaerales bacterium JB040]
MGRGFTLIELLVVILMMSVMVAVVAPGLGSVRGVQREAGASEIRRELRSAQAHARAVGRPHGVALDATADTLAALWYSTSGNVEPALTASGRVSETRAIGELFAGLDVVEIDPGDGTGVASATIWFDYLGRPELRDEDGLNPARPTSAPTVTLGEGDPIQIDPVSGVVR